MAGIEGIEFGDDDSDGFEFASPGLMSDEEEIDFGITFTGNAVDENEADLMFDDDSQFMTMEIEETEACTIELRNQDGTIETFETKKKEHELDAIKNIGDQAVDVNDFDLDFAYITALPLVLETQSLTNQKAYIDVPELEIDTEEREIVKCLHEANWRIRFKHSIATQDTMSSTFLNGSRVIHYSGHGQENALVLEKGTEPGAGQAFTPKDLFKLLTSSRNSDGKVAIKVKLVFVSACHSRMTGEAFQKAGVKHVVAVRTENELSDQAAKNFTKHFYFSLFKGRTIKEAFDIGKAIISTGDFYVRNQAEKFLLLPENADHFVRIFADGEEIPGGKMNNLTSPPVKNLLPRKWKPFCGRNQLMHQVMQHVVGETVSVEMTWLYGKKGIGKSTLLSMIAHYLRDQQLFPAGLYYLDLKEAFEDDYPQLPNKPPQIREFLGQLFEDADVLNRQNRDSDELFLKEIAEALSNQQNLSSEDDQVNEPTSSPKFLLLIDSVLDFHDDLDSIDQSWMDRWMKSLTRFFNKFVSKCSNAKIICASRDKWIKRQNFNYKTVEVTGLNEEAAERIFLNRAPEEYWKDTIKREGSIVDHDIMSFFKENNFCPGFIVDCCFEMHVNRNEKFSGKTIDTLEYDNEGHFKETLEQYSDEQFPRESLPSELQSQTSRVNSETRGMNHGTQRMPSMNQIPASTPKFGGSPHSHTTRGNSQRAFPSTINSSEFNNPEKYRIQEAAEDENWWSNVQDLKRRLRSKKTRHWNIVNEELNKSKVSADRKRLIDNFLSCFVKTIPKLLEGTTLEEAYNLRPISEQDCKLILDHFEKKAKIFDVDKTEFEGEFWNYFKKLFETLVLLRRYYFKTAVPKLVEGYISKNEAEEMLTVAYKKFKKKSVGAFVVRFSESKPGWIALAANMDNHPEKKRRIKHYRIEVNIGDSVHDEPFRVNVGDKEKVKQFKTLNTVLKRMQLKYLCVFGGTDLIKREYVFKRPDFPA